MDNGTLFSIWNNDLVIDGGEDDSLTGLVTAYLFSDGGHNGTATVNGGNISVIATSEKSTTTVSVSYTQNGGNVNIQAAGNFVFSHNVILNGGSLSASNNGGRAITCNNITVAKGASFKAVSSAGIFNSALRSFIMADGAPENSYFFAKTSEDGEFVPVRNQETLQKAAYLELKIDTHQHSFENDKCICGIKEADYSGYYAAMDRYNELTDEYKDVLVEETKDYIRAEVQKIVDEYLGGTGIKNNYTEEEQYILDGIADGVNEICDTIEAGIADGTLIKADYTEIEAKIAEFEETHSGEKYKDFIAQIKADLAETKASNKTAADAADDIAAIEEKINAAGCDHMCHKGGIAGFFWKIVNIFSKIFGLNPVCGCGIAHY